MSQARSSENSPVTLDRAILYTKEQKVLLRTIGPLVTAHAVTGIWHNSQLVTRGYPHLDFGEEIIGTRLPGPVAGKFFNFFRKHIANGHMQPLDFNTKTALKDMFQDGTITWQTDDVKSSGLTHTPEDTMIPGGIYTTGGDDPQLLMTTTRPDAALFSTVEKFATRDRRSFAVADPWDIAAACGANTLTLVGIPTGSAIQQEQAPLIPASR